MKTILISIRIIALFSTAIFISFIPENYPAFFGDFNCGKIISQYGTHTYFPSMHEVPELHWGYRHYVFSLMCFFLGVVQVINLFNFVENYKE
ncbi:MAG: hypothetical protein KA278_00500 [Flavobacterium sp.]|nr:hypothetical protein [Flavobacterium sp.]MBP6424179.1 hypothetical protein [Flavobacterium sp.]